MTSWKARKQENKYISTSFLPNFKLPFNNLIQILGSLAMAFYDLLKQRKTKNSPSDLGFCTFA